MNKELENELVCAWLEEKTESTRKNYLNSLRVFYEFSDSIDVSLTTLQEYQKHLSQRYKVSTAYRLFGVVTSLLKFARHRDYISQNVGACVRPIKPDPNEKVEERLLTVDEVKTLMDNASNERNRIMIRTAYLLGLRIHELLNLHWDDFFNGGNMVKVIGKGSKQRFIRVPDSLLADLKTLDTTGFIFQNRLGKPMTAPNAHIFLKKIIDRTGLNPSISWHWFRHSCATHSLKNGASPDSLRKKLGHSTIGGLGTYLHDDEDASQFLDL